MWRPGCYYESVCNDRFRRIYLDGDRNNHAIGASTATTERCEEIWTGARICSDHSPICQDDSRFQDLVAGQAKVTGCWGMAAPLDIAADDADCLYKVSNSNLKERKRF